MLFPPTTSTCSLRLLASARAHLVQSWWTPWGRGELMRHVQVLPQQQQQGKHQKRQRVSNHHHHHHHHQEQQQQQQQQHSSQHEHLCCQQEQQQQLQQQQQHQEQQLQPSHSPQWPLVLLLVLLPACVLPTRTLQCCMRPQCQ